VAACDKPQPDLLILALRLLRFADLTGARLPAADRRIVLGSQERMILSKVAQGLPNKAIAQEQGISVRTVGSHLQHIFRKLDASNRMEAVLHARQQGLLRNE
jgi:LuxR family maltose regulon positive regulatory protein